MGQIIDNIYIDGKPHLIEVLVTLEIDGIEYMVCQAFLGNGLSDILASRIVVAEDGYDDLASVENRRHKRMIDQFINQMIANAKVVRTSEGLFDEENMQKIKKEFDKRRS